MEGIKMEVLHQEHLEWLNKLDFYKDDIAILKRRIEEVAAKNTGHDVMAMIEHFQNQLIIQRNELDEFRHAIKEHENELEAAVKSNPTATNRQRLSDDPMLRTRMERYETIFNELRMELYRFLSKSL
ncbi:MAG: hypothetical protein KBH11_00850 [Bacteroidia bacterium]|jgi:hypothetical protein|nr:hypothetical protein [Bacteroidota bacterium]MBL7913955.1 hypothetical protein [Bacteroidia bacterium]OQA11262.1 MAG: hypothetical protein BWY67_01009 [Bacteroidetes bacterium ADurb.Bin397]MBK7971442.1 hypothetical protein [Bacteroidota bacterium]MBK8414665.1 hypothetical protein [Bacteroidota bacterium]